MYSIGEREMVFCPYNRYHIVSKLRIQKHLVKCQKNYPKVKLATCFYNYSHRLKPEDMLKHYEICSHKTRLEGSRFYEPNNFQESHSIENRDPYSQKFPHIHAKPKFFTNPVKLSSFSKPRGGKKFNSSNSRSESDYQLRAGNGDIKTEFSDDDLEDDLEPLPLPKTVSKAFVCMHQSSGKFMPRTSPNKRFGRGKNFLAFSPTKPSRRTSDDLQLDLNAAESDRQNRNEESNFFSKGNTTSITPSMLEFDYVLKSKPKSVSNSIGHFVTSAKLYNHGTLKSESQLLSTSNVSLTSSVFDDSITLNSEEIIFDKDNSEEDKSDEAFILKNFNSNLKI